eukprot:4647520-Pleurochrysis_carterae.AAC.3
MHTRAYKRASSHAREYNARARAGTNAPARALSMHARARARTASPCVVLEPLLPLDEPRALTLQATRNQRQNECGVQALGDAVLSRCAMLRCKTRTLLAVAQFGDRATISGKRDDLQKFTASASTTKDAVLDVNSHNRSRKPLTLEKARAPP